MDEAALLLSVQPLVRTLVWRFKRRWPCLDWEEVLDACQPKLVEVVRAYDEERRECTLQTWVWTCMERFLIWGVRQRLWTERHSHKVGLPLHHLDLSPPARPQAFSLRGLFAELSDEAGLAVRLGLSLRGKKKLVSTLRKDFGWTKSEVFRALKEVREALE